MLLKRILLLTGFIGIIIGNNSIKAQTCSCTRNISVTSAGYGTNITVASGEVVCVNGPASAPAGVINSGVTITVAGTGTLCFSGLITINANLASVSNGSTIYVQSGAVINHTGTFDLQSAGWNGRTSFYNYGTYNNTKASSNTFYLNGTVLYNYGTFSTLGDLVLDPKADAVSSGGAGPLAMNNYSTGSITIGGKLNLSWGSAAGTLTNSGSLTASCYVTSGGGPVIFGKFSNPAGSTVTFTGTDASCGAKTFDSGTTLTQINGTLNVQNGTAKFSAASSATDLSGAKMYVKDFIVPAQTFNTTPNCLSVQVTGVVTMNSGSTYLGNIFIWDKSFTAYGGTNNGDTYGGVTFGCVLSGSGASGCGSGFVNTTYQTDMDGSATGKVYYSATDNGSSVGCPTLPVTFVRFNANHSSYGNQLTWTTAEEKNAQTFIVERSLYGVRFEAVGAVNANGNASTLSNYQFIDTDGGSGIVYYRINEIDKDGSKMYSNIISISTDREDIAILLGNPVREEIKIQLLTDNDNSISLINAQGDVVFEKSYSGIQQVNIKSQFAPGVYILKVSNEEQINFIKVIIE